MKEIAEIGLIFLIGAVLGGACGFFKLPVPAPPTVTGVIGILGVTLGYIVVMRLRAGG